jgi:dTDP-4-amino-4,6-dideoxygalactose transaminase
LLKPLADYGILPIENHSGSGHVYHLYVIRVTETCPLERTNLQTALAEMGIQTGIHYPIPCHLQPAFQHLGYQSGDFPHAEALSQEILSLPMYPGLSATQIQQVVATMKLLIDSCHSSLQAPCFETGFNSSLISG